AAGTRSLVEWTRGLIADTGANVKIDWHGHNDRGLAVSNAIAALAAGVHRVHSCGLGIGERVGNTSMDLLLLNLKLMRWIDQDLSALVGYVRKVSEACRFPIPRNYPLSGEDAFRTATGVHAPAIIKAKTRGNDWLADRVYSGVPAGEFGKQQEIEIGHMSGMSNVKYWLGLRGIPFSDELCKDILARAKSSPSTLSEEEILSVVARHSPSRQGAESAKRHQQSGWEDDRCPFTRLALKTAAGHYSRVGGMAGNQVFTGIKVFSTTLARDREAMGENITKWLKENPDAEIVDKVVTQSSDKEFHCLTITLFYRMRS